MEAVMLVRYAEIHLKGLNRPYFERSLMKRISLALRPLRVKVVREQGRVFVFGIPQEEMDAAADKLTRVFGIDGNPAERRIEQQLWQLADVCTPAAGAATYTQAIMDLGATLCTRRRPACALCPLAARCIARSSGRQHELPTSVAHVHKPLFWQEFHTWPLV